MDKLMVIVVVGVVAMAGAKAEKRHVHPKFMAVLKKHTCDYEHENERTNIMLESSCGEPRDVFVELKPEGSHQQVLPGAVWVKRCVGLCFDPSKQCIATSKRDRKIPVRYLDVSTGKESCATYIVEEHLECGCGCPVSASACRDGQQFNHRKCKCECTNLEERRKCIEKRHDGSHTNLRWNRSKCACEDRHT